MNRKTSLIALIITVVLGSVVTFYSSNMFFADIANFEGGFLQTTFFASVPGMMLGLIFLLISLFIIRANKRPNTVKRLAKTYLIIQCSFALVGLIGAILAGFINYQSFIKPYPFPGYLIIAIIIHSLFIIASIVLYILVNKYFKEDTERFKVTIKHVGYTFAVSFYTLLAFNCLGAFLLSPVYIQWRTLYKTFPFYLSLLIPVIYFIYRVLDMFNLFKRRKDRLFLASEYLAASIILPTTSFIIGMLDTQFISAISPVLPLERLASMPIDMILHTIIYIISGVIIFVHELRRKDRPEELNNQKDG